MSEGSFGCYWDCYQCLKRSRHASKKKFPGRICSIPPKKMKIANNIYFSLFPSGISTRSCENDWERPYTEVGFVLPAL
jgi:hypothetical protein